MSAKLSRIEPTNFKSMKAIQPTLRNKNGSIYVIFSHPLYPRQDFSLDLRDDRPEIEQDGKSVDPKNPYPSTVNWNIARGKCAEIVKDCSTGRYNPATRYLYKYNPRNLIAIDPESINPQSLSLKDIWHDYSQHCLDTNQWEESNYIDNQRITKRINKFFSDPKYLSDPLLVQNTLLATYSKETTRRTLQQINAACNWATLRPIGLLKDNPFTDLPKIRQTKGTKNYSNQPFTVPDIHAIIKAFKENTYVNYGFPEKIGKLKVRKPKLTHSFYTDYVRFMFLTGCRPEEACELKKCDIHNAYINISRAYRGDINVHKNTKNFKKRRFPINAQLQEIIDRQASLYSPFNSNDYLFRSIRGKQFDYSNFSSRTWKTVLYGLLDHNLISRYLPPYNCKHTFITHALAQNISPKQLEAWTGVSANVILSNYAGYIDSIKPPALYAIDLTSTNKDTGFEFISL